LCRSRSGYYNLLERGMREVERRKKPPRLGRVFQAYGSPLYFVTFNTWRRQRILDRASIQDAFIGHGRKVSELGVAIGRYVIMPDHVHLFVRIGLELRLGVTVKHIKQAITKAVREEAPGLRVWQPAFFDHLLRSSESYGEKWEYVRQNPVRAGLVKLADEWPYQGEIVRIDRL